MRKLPIGIQSFDKFHDNEYLYIDKTSHIARMASRGGAWFLSRPRRFGKSLLLDTMDCAFSGRRELFAGLYLDRSESAWDWTQTWPVIRFDFGISTFRTVEELESFIKRRLAEYAGKWNVSSLHGTCGEQLYSLLSRLERPAVVLVDEYDKPILDRLAEGESAEEARKVLRSFYGALKPSDPYLRFVFLTGVSKFSKAGVFSGLNHLNDITLDRNYGTICGYTQEDIDAHFAPLLAGFDRELVRDWYNGYSWGNEGVYNPFDILLLCDKQEIRSWWFETGTPGFLIKMLARQDLALPELDKLWLGSELADSVEVEDMSLPVMLFQTGYLTLKERKTDPFRGERFRLGFPNHEVRMAYCRLSLIELAGNREAVDTNVNRLWDILESGNGPALRDLFVAFFSSIPTDNYRRNEIARYEGFYASVVYAYFAGLGLSVIPEDVTNRGRIDLTVIGPRGIWIFEFKVLGLDRSGDEAPLAQILRKDYAAKYRGRLDAAGTALPLRQVGIIFDPDSRNISGWEEA